MFKLSLFQEITNDCCHPSTKLDETIEAYPFVCKEWLTTELSYIKDEFHGASRTYTNVGDHVEHWNL
jgi:hypothetical protein